MLGLLKGPLGVVKTVSLLLANDRTRRMNSFSTKTEKLSFIQVQPFLVFSCYLIIRNYLRTYVAKYLCVSIILKRWLWLCKSWRQQKQRCQIWTPIGYDQSSALSTKMFLLNFLTFCEEWSLQLNKVPVNTSYRNCFGWLPARKENKASIGVAFNNLTKLWNTIDR